jgi:ribosomal protein S18 acetylase RimI-like enzyme
MLNKIANLHKECFPNKPWAENDFLELKNSGCEIIASDSGFIVWRAISDETEIITLGVAPAARGTGIADAMLALMEKEISKKTKLLFKDAASSPPVEGWRKVSAPRSRPQGLGPEGDGRRGRTKGTDEGPGCNCEVKDHPAASPHPSTGGELKIFLEVSDKNIHAIKLYERNGYEKISVRKNYYSDGSDAIIMQKFL